MIKFELWTRGKGRVRILMSGLFLWQLETCDQPLPGPCFARCQLSVETRLRTCSSSAVMWQLLTFALVSASHCVAHNYHLDKETINWLSRNQHPGLAPDADIISGSLGLTLTKHKFVSPIMPSLIICPFISKLSSFKHMPRISKKKQKSSISGRTIECMFSSSSRSIMHSWRMNKLRLNLLLDIEPYILYHQALYESRHD